MGILKERFPGLRVAGCASPPKASLLEMDHQGLRETLAALDHGRSHLRLEVERVHDRIR